MIDPSFRNINRLFVLSFKNSENDPAKSSPIEYYVSLIEIKDFEVLIDNKQFFDQPVKASKKPMKTCRNVKKQ